MRVGVPREIMQDEYRVALTPAGVRELVSRNHTVIVERGAGEGSSLPDDDYAALGAVLVDDGPSVWAQAEMILKVKEPIVDEFLRLTPDHILFTYLHLAPNPELTRGLLDSGATCLAYETVEDEHGHLPLLAPMSEIAGRLVPHAGAYFLERMNGGKGKLLSGATGVAASNVLILGAGIAGSNAALITAGMQAKVTVLDIDLERLHELERYLPHVECLMSNQLTIDEKVARADFVIGAVLVPGGRAPTLVTEEMVATMQPGSVVADLSIDQGGCIATSRMTTHSEPTFMSHGVVHYGVGNMAGAVPITSTHSLTNGTLPYVIKIAEEGVAQATRRNPAIARGVNVIEGKVTNKRVAEATGNPFFPLESLLPIDID